MFEALLPEGLTRAQFSVLNNFVRLGGSRSPAQLAEAFQVTRGAMTNTLKRLEARGCISIKTVAHDGRRKVVNITPQGRRLRDAAIAATSGEVDAMTSALGQRELDELLPGLIKLRRYLDEQRNEE